MPLLIHLPKNQYAGKRVSGFAQTADVLPTVLGRLNLKPPARVTGEDLWPYITGEKSKPAGIYCFVVWLYRLGTHSGVELLRSLG